VAMTQVASPRQQRIVEEAGHIVQERFGVIVQLHRMHAAGRQADTSI
jgi:hypothetical protein